MAEDTNSGTDSHEAAATRFLSTPAGSPLAVGLPARAMEQIIAFLDDERDQWIIWSAVALGAGSAAYFSLPFEPALASAIAAFIVVASLLFAFPRHTLVTVALGLTLAAVTGFTLAKLKTEWVRAPVLKISGKVFQIEGTITQIEPRRAAGLRLTIVPDKIGNIRDRWRPRTIRLSVRANLKPATADLKTGQRVALRARLNPPPGPALPGGFDFARYAWFQGLGAVGFAVSMPKQIVGDDTARGLGPISAWIKELRSTIGKRVSKSLPTETGAIANALLTGERGEISDATNDAYRGAGLYHILSISGLHMAIMAGAVFYLLRFLLALVPPIALSYPIKKWAAAGAIMGAFAYLLISGGAFATVRSFIMIVIMFVAILVDRPALALRNVAIAAIVIMVLFPESILDPGFQMSFAAVAALVVGFELLKGVMPEADTTSTPARLVKAILLPMSAIVLSTVIASAAVMPFAIYHFHNAQHYAVLANLVAMPACNLIVMPMALTTLIALPFGLEFIPLYAMGFGIDVMTATATWVAGLPGAVSHPPAIATYVFALIVAGGLILLIVRQIFRLAGLALIALGIALAPGNTPPDLLIGRDANLVALTLPNGKLAALSLPPIASRPNRAFKTTAPKKPPFELTRWMEHIGDSRPGEAAFKSKVFRCDRLGCTARLKGTTLAFPNHPAAIQEDCATSQLVITNINTPKTCTNPTTIIDRKSVRAGGTHAIYISKQGDMRVITASQTRGNRPWAPKRAQRRNNYARTN